MSREAAGEVDEQQILQLLQLGQTPDQVRRILGPPRRMCRQILYHRYLEQWAYERPFRVRLRFDCPRGQEPRLSAIDPPSGDRP